MRTAIVTLVLMLLPALTFAQNPCTTALPTGVSLVSASSEVVATLADFNVNLISAPGVSKVTEWQMGIFLPGQDPTTSIPVTAISIPKSAWTLKATTTDCYGSRPPTLFGIPSDTVLVAHLRGRRLVTQPEDGPWSVVSNSFGRPSPISATTGVRVLP